MNRRPLLLASLFLLPATALAQRGQGDTAQHPMLIEGKQSLYQRVIARPGAALSAQPDGHNAKPVPGFTVFYVYARQGGEQGYVQVGRSMDGRVEGWLPAAKAIDWQHTMIATFTNPSGRQRVLFSRSEHDERLLMLDLQAGDKAQQLLDQVRDGHPPEQVVAVEPTTAVDFVHHPYLMPILSADRVEREVGPPLRLLEVISAPADHPAQARADPGAMRSYQAGVVFLIDTTASMQPYIERTRDAVRSIVTRIANSPVHDHFRFGLVAYRDSLEDNPGLEYTTRVYARPDFAKPADAINAAIAQVHDSPVSSTGFDEDPIGGLHATLNQIDWESLGGRYIVLITDAGARPSTHPHSVTRLNIAEIHELAKAKGVAVFVIHLLTPAGRAIHDHERARSQYEELTSSNAAGSLYYPVPDGAPEAFARTVEQLSLQLVTQVGEATGQPVDGAGHAAQADSHGDPHMEEQVRVVSEAMRLDYLGRVENTRAPDVVRSWTTDRDLKDSTIASLDVRVLLTRNQLSDLAKSLDNILAAGLAGRTEPRTFFTQLRSTFAAAARDPQRIATATTIGAMLGEYLDGLPYQSEVMDIAETDWLAMGAIAQRTVLNNVEAKRRLYQEFEAQPDKWINLSGTSAAGEAMYPVPIEALP